MLRRRPLVSLLLVLAFLGFALPSTAQVQHPVLERGFSPEKAFELGELDNVNLFNGNLSLVIPIGQRYPLGGGFDYGLVLTYNSSPWRFEEVIDNGVAGTAARPMPDDNAGFGWVLGMGKMRPPTAGVNDSSGWVYVSPDGGDRRFFTTMHEGETTSNSTLSYSRDGSYLRSKSLTNGWREVAFPDGQLHSFDPTGMLRSITKAGHTAGVSVTATTVGTLQEPAWQISDGYGRTHYVVFKDRQMDGETRRTVDRVELAAFGTQTAIYRFTYTQTSVPRPSQHSDSSNPNASVPLLTRITLPDGSAFTMAYGGPEGRASKLVLPTLGSVEWTFRNYNFPRRIVPSLDKHIENPDLYTSSKGVGSRKLTSPSGTLLGTWTYTQILDVDKTTRTEVVDPLGHERVHYFQADPNSHTFGLPYGSAKDATGTRSLSTQIVKAGGTLLRSTYVRYEWDRPIGAPDTLGLDAVTDLNRRLASQRTVYHDDGGVVADLDLSGFDGLGHYRTRKTGGTFSAANLRTTFTQYNPGQSYPHEGVGASFTTPSTWTLGTFTEASETEGTTAKRQFCVQATTGRILRERVQRSSAVGSTDLLRLYQYDANGNLTQERYFGGDTQAVSTGSDLCTLIVPSVDQYRIDHTWSNGSLATSRYVTSTGTAMSFFLVDRTIDARTGLPSSERDSAGVATSFLYDASGRLTWRRPATGQGAWTQLTYTNALGTSPARVAIFERPNGSSSTSLSRSEIDFDPFGRLRQERKYQPNGTVSVRETGYDALGQRTYVTEAGIGSPAVQRTSYLSYDPFGRPTTVRPPDGAAHDVTFSYFGDQVTSRSAKIGTSRNATTGAIVESSVTTREIYDRQGRLWRVWENDNGGGVRTEYGYDVGQRLATVSQVRTVGTSTVTQTRRFNYDGRGFLTSEQHPEKGVSGNGSVSYFNYDARGHAGRVIDGPHDLSFSYDRAERLTQTRETFGSQRVLSSFTYATSNAFGSSNGKLRTALQHNYFPEFGGLDFPVQETFTYFGVGGRVSALETRINTNDVYTQTFVWDDLGNLKQQGYPSCGHCPPSAGVPSRTVSYTYAEGFLTAVPGWASSITYHPSGMVSQITHANTVVSTWAESPHKMARPGSLTVAKGISTLFSSGAYQYDGSGNVVAIGSDYYLYDRFGRLLEGTVFKAGSSRKQTYGYDGFNNLTSIATWTNGIASIRTLSVSTTSNRLTGAAYDAAGNQATWGTQAYSWNPESRMYRYAVDGASFYHAFSTDGERAMTYHAETGRSTFRIRGLDGKVVREVSHLQGAANPWTWEKDWIHRDGQLLATVTPAEGTRYAHADHLGSPRIVTDSAGTVRGTYHYFPFGEQAGTAPTSPEALRFTGHERDGGASASAVADDLDYMHQRFYHPQLGRFLSFDPVGGMPRTPQSWNRFAYVLGNPMRYIDPEGLRAATFYDSITVVDGGCANCYFTRDFWEMRITQARQEQQMEDWTLGDRVLSAIHPTVAQSVGEGIVGFGDTVSFGFTEWVRTEQGLADMVSTESIAYHVGEAAGFIHGTATGGSGVYRLSASTRLFGNRAWLNRGQKFRIGHSTHKGITRFSLRGERIDRISGKARTHVDLWTIRNPR